MQFFPHLQAVLPALKAAEAAFDAFLATQPLTNETVWAEAEKLNVVIRQAVAAFATDTKETNSRSTLESIYLRKIEGLFPLGGLTHKQLTEACQTGRAP